MRTAVQKQSQPVRASARKFKIDCLPYIFSIEELEELEKHGHKLQALAEGKMKPITVEERLFVKVCNGQSTPLSPMETAWVKYTHRHEMEAVLLQTDELYKEYLRLRKC